MYPYQNPDLSTEERISDLMSRMTLEEKILQTDQYYSGDFTTQDENGKVTAVDMQRFDALMQHNSVGCPSQCCAAVCHRKHTSWHPIPF